MKKNYSIIILLVISLFAVSNAKATIVIIQAIGTSAATDAFNPQVANAVCGDTIRWVLVSGTHTTASTTIPVGATPWSSPNITVSGYDYIVTVPGTYNYTCHPATGGHMGASIVVSCTTGLPHLITTTGYSVYPNPSNGKFTIAINNSSNSLLNVYNANGETIYQSELTTPISERDLGLPEGIYFYILTSKENIIGKGNIVIQK